MVGVKVEGVGEKGGEGGVEGFELVERGEVVKVEGVCFVAGLGEGVGKRMRAAARKKLEKYFGSSEGDSSSSSSSSPSSSSSSSSSGIEIDIEFRDDSNTSLGRGGGILLTLHTTPPTIHPSSSSPSSSPPPTVPLLAFSGLAEKGKKAEDVGEEAAEGLIEQIEGGGCVDEYMQVCSFFFFFFFWLLFDNCYYYCYHYYYCSGLLFYYF